MKLKYEVFNDKQGYYEWVDFEGQEFLTGKFDINDPELRKHDAYGWMECLWQSDHAPMWEPTHFRMSRESFYCQSDIEGEEICNNQCDHCEEYYKPLTR